MSLRATPWPIFGANTARRATEQEQRKQGSSRPNLRVLEGGNVSRLERLTPRVRVLSLVFMVGMVLFGVIAFQVMLAQGQFHLENMQARADKEQVQYEKLRLQVAQLESPERITETAKNNLGLVQAESVTPITPDASNMAKGEAEQFGAISSPADDPGEWGKIKPHLSSSAK